MGVEDVVDIAGTRALELGASDDGWTPVSRAR